MLLYILKRLLIFIPTLLVISLLTFFISINAPGDPVEQMLNIGGSDSQMAEKLATEKSFIIKRAELGLDKPIFYFSLAKLSECDTIHRIPKRYQRESLERLTNDFGNWPAVEKYYKALLQLEISSFETQKTDENAQDLIDIRERASTLLINHDEFIINDNIEKLIKLAETRVEFNKILQISKTVSTTYKNLSATETTWKNYIPTINFYGLDNQYHFWMFGDKSWYSSMPWVDDSNEQYRGKGFVRGDFGVSYQDHRPIQNSLWDKIKWTLILSVLSIILTYLIAIPIGVYCAVNKGSLQEKSLTTILFMLYSLPNFWIGTLLIVFVGGQLEWFPVYGVGNVADDAGFFETLRTRAYHLAMPLFCWTYGALAYLSRQMRGGMLTVMGQDYIRTARAKGLNKGKVVWKHSFRNSLLPIITLFANVFPLMIGGSIVLELIFSIQGMGSWAINAIYTKDYPVIYTIMMLGAILTMIGYLVADILYAVVDPRITYTAKR